MVRTIQLLGQRHGIGEVRHGMMMVAKTMEHQADGQVQSEEEAMGSLDGFSRQKR